MSIGSFSIFGRVRFETQSKWDLYLPESVSVIEDFQRAVSCFGIENYPDRTKRVKLTMIFDSSHHCRTISLSNATYSLHIRAGRHFRVLRTPGLNNNRLGSEFFKACVRLAYWKYCLSLAVTVWASCRASIDNAATGRMETDGYHASNQRNRTRRGYACTACREKKIKCIMDRASWFWRLHSL